MVVTDLGVFALARRGEPRMELIEMAHGVTLDEIRAKTEARFEVALR